MKFIIGRLYKQQTAQYLVDNKRWTDNINEARRFNTYAQAANQRSYLMMHYPLDNITVTSV